MVSVTDTIRYIGVNDHQIDLFEGQYPVPNGMAYNSYVILDQKIAVMDTVDINFTQEWLRNLETELGGRKPDYLVIQHMEPDHSASIRHFLEAYPDTTVVATAKAFAMISQFFDLDLADHALTAENGATLSLGAHELNFIFAPMVHWPEVMMTYDSTDKVLFSADAFGKFGALDVLLYRHRRQIRSPGTERTEKSCRTGYPDHLPASRPRFKGQPCTLYRKIQHLVFLRSGV